MIRPTTSPLPPATPRSTALLLLDLAASLSEGGLGGGDGRDLALRAVSGEWSGAGAGVTGLLARILLNSMQALR